MAYDPTVVLPLGQQPMASSAGVVISSNQSPVSVTGTVLVGNFPATTINQSVSGTLNINPTSVLILNPSGPTSVLVLNPSIPVTQSGPWTVSVVGIQQASVQGNIGVTNFPTTQNISGSVVATQGTNPWIITGSVQGVSNQSVSGQVGASIVGLTPVAVTNTPSISGTVLVGNFPTNQNVSGSVATWLQSSNASVITVGSPVANQSVSGTIAATQQGAWTMSVVGILQSSVQGNVGVTNFPTNQNISGSVISFQGGAWTQSVVGTININPASVLFLNASLPVTQSGIWATSMVGVASVSQAGIWNTGVTGSVAAFQGGAWAVSVVGILQSSVQGNVGVTNFPTTQNVSGSIAAFQTGAWSTSIVGAPIFAEDSGHTTADKGIFVLTVRNDTLASITSTDMDYSPHVTGPAGETIVSNAPLNRWVFGVASNFTGIEQPVIAAQGTSVFTYITAAQFSNQSATAALVKLKSSAGGATILNAVVPANSAQSMTFPNGLKSITNGAITSSINAVASVYVNLQGFTSKFDV